MDRSWIGRVRRGSGAALTHKKRLTLPSILFAFALAPASAGLPVPVAGQEPERSVVTQIAGRLLDAGAGSPISGASISIEVLGMTTLSDVTGAFRFTDVPGGTYQLTVQHVAFGVRNSSIDVPSGGTLTLEFRLEPEAIALDPLEVEVDWRPEYLERVGFYDRRAEEIGEFFDPAFVQRWSVGSWGAARNLLGDIILGLGGPLRGGGFSCRGGPQVIIDGQLDEVGLISTMSSSNVGAVEVYRGPYKAPDVIREARADPFCLAVIIWTRQWLDEHERERRRIVLCEPKESPEDPLLLVEGAVTDELTGVMLPRSTVTAWVTRSNGERDEEVTIADDQGRYRFCALDPRYTVVVWAGFANRNGGTAMVEPQGPASLTRDLTVPISRPGRIVGRVLDLESGRPIGAADVFVGGSTPRAWSDEQGFFEIRDLSPGDHEIVVSHLGYGRAVDSVSVGSGGTTDVRTELSVDPIKLAPIVVSAARDPRLDARGFYDRRQWSERLGQGHFFTREDIERLAGARATSLVGQTPGIRTVCDGSNCRLISSRASGCRQVPVYLNGALAIGSADRDSRGLDALVRLDELAAVEVYTSASSLPGDFAASSNRCGAIVLWTR